MKRSPDYGKYVYVNVLLYFAKFYYINRTIVVFILPVVIVIVPYILVCDPAYIVIRISQVRVKFGELMKA